MKKLFLPLVAIVCLLLAVAWMAGLFDEKVQPGSEAVQPVEPGDVYMVRQESSQAYESVPATVESAQSTIISARITARIREVPVRAGESVKRGQLLVRLESDDLESRSAQARSRIDAVSARLNEAGKQFARAETLARSGTLSQADLDRARANRDSLQAELEQAREALREARSQAAFAEIVAPMDGRIVDRFAEPGDTAQPGAKLMTMYNPEALRVEANIREQLATRLQPGQKLKVGLASGDRTLESVIEEIVPAGDPTSRTFLVKSRLPDDSGLLPGMYATVQIPSAMESVVLVPVDRVAEVGQLNVVWLLRDGTVQRQFVRLGRLRGSEVEIVSGLQAGDRVLTPQLLERPKD